MGKTSNLPSRPTLWLVFIATIVCAALWYANYQFLVALPATERGTYGDMFGAVNSIFTGLAFVGLIYANMQQRHEIDIARTEARDTRAILDQQQSHLDRQNREIKKQSFENTFFQLLRLYTELTENIDLINGDNTVTKGKDVFPVFVSRIRRKFTHPSFAHLKGIEKYEAFYQEHNSELGHYFRILYNILKFVNRSDIDDKRFYTNIVRAQISDAEIAVIFYNCASKYGRKRLLPLTEEYNLLKNINDRDVFDPSLWDAFPMQYTLRSK